MPDPRVLQPHAAEFYEKKTLMPDFYHYASPPIGGWPSRETHDATQKALNAAHDRIRKLVHINDYLRRDQGDLLAIVKSERRWRRGIFTSLLVAIFLMLADILLR